MDVPRLIERLERTGAVVPSLVRGLSREESLYRPDEETWSILEIVCHLADEEERDFRPRLERTLADPQPAWDPIDPPGWATAHAYRDADLEERTDRFVSERKRSVRWLSGLGTVDWSRAYEHPKIGPIRAGDLLSSWAAHDALHLRQIAKRMHELASVDMPGHSSRYAGEWGA